MASIDIDWAALASVFGVSLIVTVALVGAFTLGIKALARREAAVAANGSPVPATAAASACFLVCAAAVAYGIQLIVV